MCNLCDYKCYFVRHFDGNSISSVDHDFNQTGCSLFPGLKIVNLFDHKLTGTLNGFALLE